MRRARSSRTARPATPPTTPPTTTGVGVGPAPVAAGVVVGALPEPLLGLPAEPVPDAPPAPLTFPDDPDDEA